MHSKSFVAGALITVLAFLSAFVMSAQVDRSASMPTTPMRLSVQNTGLAVTTVAATLLALNVMNVDRTFVQCQNSGQAFQTFRVYANATGSGILSTLASVTADYTTAIKAPMIGASADLTTLTATATGWFLVDTKGIDQLTVTATSATGTATVSCYASGGGM